MNEQIETTEFDSPWKDILEDYLPQFIAFFFPQVYTEIDWNLGFEFLDQELRQVVKEAELGKRYVDKLVKLYQQGQEVWVLLHIEIQSQYEVDFAKRMFTYHYRIFDRYDKKVGSLAILGDESKNWRPCEFNYELFGSKITFEFPVVKLLDLGQDWEALENSHNPFAVVVMAHLKANKTKKDKNERLRWKIALIKVLYDQRYKKEDIIKLFKFIDWVMNLPKPLEIQFWQEVYQLEEERQMRLKFDDCQIPDLRQSEYGLNLRDIQWLDYGKPNGFDKLIRAIDYQFGSQKVDSEKKIQ
ncbi:cytosolic protein [Crocosphaera sp. XPORK-15E]|uniref:cytosolic protein n=1 Tax=Crocosphaera sp. XPORK-15E TaxID=3110247 RepID=UPI002B2056BC|nr:cytosolic protein [Crocosphaera sp. XPORK-15E]MEA5533461.1 cytosolic protein [Crocosphaera sp. XPORK-15E]